MPPKRKFGEIVDKQEVVRADNNDRSAKYRCLRKLRATEEWANCPPDARAALEARAWSQAMAQRTEEKKSKSYILQKLMDQEARAKAETHTGPTEGLDAAQSAQTLTEEPQASITENPSSLSPPYDLPEPGIPNGPSHGSESLSAEDIMLAFLLRSHTEEASG